MSLNKRDIQSALFCSKQLWLQRQRPDLVAEISAETRFRMEQGRAVGERARQQFPMGVLIDWSTDPIAETARLLAAGETTLFEATFRYNDVTIRVDVLSQAADGGWHLIEVKNSGSVKDEHYSDVAAQLYVLRGAGLAIIQMSVMHLNKAYTDGNGEGLFALVDISAEATALLPAVAAVVEQRVSLLTNSQPPTVSLGLKCRQCSFQTHCWQHVGDKCVYAVPRLGKKKEAALQAAGVEHLDDWPADLKLTATQQKYVAQLDQPAELSIDRGAIQAELAQLQFPLYFLDFEADNPPIPRYTGYRPFERIPFHFSCHILYADGRLEQFEYLHTEDSDPRAALATQLVRGIGATGSVIAYWAAYERGVLNELAGAVGVYSAELISIRDRLWDQLNIFRRHYSDPRFEGSNSLKAVLPVLCPHLSYAELAVQNGIAAQIGWNRLLACEEQHEREQLEIDLLAYCRLDTLAMVEIHRVLIRL